MSTTSKSPRKVALVALEVGKEALPDYSHRFSPKVFTQAQLFACLVLKQFFRTDYRGIMGILADTPNLCQTIGLRKVPHWTTLQKASRRLLGNAPVQKLLDATLARARMETLLADAGYDAEWVHCVGREDLGIRTIIPPKIGRPTGKAPTGYYRRVMSQRPHLTSYGQRWQVETTVSRTDIDRLGDEAVLRRIGERYGMNSKNVRAGAASGLRGHLSLIVTVAGGMLVQLRM